MKEIIHRILDGKFDYENGSLDFSTAKLELTLEPGAIAQGSFCVFGMPGRNTEGYLISSSERMTLDTGEFRGEETQIGYTFDASGMESGDVVKGSVHVISNQGEYSLPFVVMISYPVLMTSLGPVKNLFHFANLAKSSFREAVELFYSKGFRRIFTGSDAGYYDLYRCLSAEAMNEQNVEEFLISVHKKERTNLIIDEDKIRIDSIYISMPHNLVLTRVGWGYTRVHVEAVGDFLEVDKELLTEADFDNNRAVCQFRIDPEKLHGGVNFGRIRCFDNFTETSVDIEVRPDKAPPASDSNYREKTNGTIELLEYYAAFRMKKMTAQIWMEKNGKVIEHMMELDDQDPVPKLYKAHLLITQKHFNEAEWMMDQARTSIYQSKDMDPSIWYYYRYLKTLTEDDPDQLEQTTREIRTSYERNPDNWRLAWLLLYLSPEFTTSYARKWLFIKQQFERGCISPVFYVEALILLRMEPTIFMELGSFELRILNYAAKKGILTGDIIMQLHYLVPKCKNFSPVLLNILKAAYEVTEDQETLTFICSMYIRAGKRDKESFSWYEKGVECNLRVAGLYEYYLNAMDLSTQHTLPKVIYMYFSYENTLDWEHAAYLYECLTREKEEYPDIYRALLPRMREFLLQCASQGRISNSLAVLYRGMLNDDLLGISDIPGLAALLCCVEISVEDSRLKHVVVRYAKELAEHKFEIHDGIVRFPVFNQDYAMVFEDAAGNRYSSGINYDTRQFMTRGRVLNEAILKDTTTMPLQIHLCGTGGEQPVSEDNAERFELVIASPQVDAAYKGELIPKLVRYYFEKDEMEKLDALLAKIRPQGVESSQRAEIVRYMVARGMHERALSWVQFCGIHAMQPKSMWRLAEELVIQRSDSKLLPYLCYYGFENNKYSDFTLYYLSEHFEGRTRQLRDIWNKMKDAGMELHALTERLIIQMLFTGYFVGEKMEMFRNYIQGDASLAVEKAFLSQCSYDYFVKDKVLESIVFEDMMRLMSGGEDMQEVCALAYVKYYAENRKLIGDGQRIMLEKCLRRLLKKDVILPCYTAYVELFPFMRRFEDHMILEYKTKPGYKARIHYMFESREDGGNEYHTLELQDVYGGVCSCSFVLFFGEKLLYYITESSDDHEELTESGSLAHGDMGQESFRNRFSMLNDVAIADALQDYDTLDEVMEDYIRTDYIQEHLFTLK